MAGDLGATLGTEGWTVPGTAGSTTNLQTAAEMGESLGGSGWSVPGTAGDVANVGTGGNINAQLTAQGWDVRFDSPPTFALDFLDRPEWEPAYAHARDTTSLVRDYLGHYIELGVGEIGLEGGRRVKNLLDDTDTLATQGVTVEDADYWLSFTGTGSVAVSGVATTSLAGTGASDRVSKKITAGSAGTMTLTVTGSVTNAMLTKSRAGQTIADPEYVSRGVEILGGEIIPAGEGDGTSFAAWVDASTLPSTAGVSGGTFVGTHSGATVRMRYQMATLPGKQYRLTFHCGADTPALDIGTSAGGSQILSTAVSTGTNSVSFTATTNTTWLNFYDGSTGFVLDNFSCRPIVHHAWGADGVRWLKTGPNGEDLTDAASGYPVRAAGAVRNPAVTNLWPYANAATADLTTKGNISDVSGAFGLSNAVRFGDNSATRYGYRNLTLTGDHVLQVLVKTLDGLPPTDTTLTLYFDQVVDSAPNIDDMGDGTYRVWTTRSCSGLSKSSGVIKYTSDDARGFDVLLWQVHAGTAPKPFVLTDGAAVAAAADDDPIDAATAGWDSDNGGVIAVALTQLLGLYGAAGTLIEAFSDANNRFTVTINASGDLEVEQVVGGVTVVSDTAANPIVVGTESIIVARVEANDVGVWVDGVQVFSDTSAAVPPVNAIAILSTGVATSNISAAKRVAYTFDAGTLTDSQCLSMSNGNLPPIPALTLTPEVTLVDSNLTADAVTTAASPGDAIGVQVVGAHSFGRSVSVYSLDEDFGNQFSINASTGVVVVGSGALAAGTYDLPARATFDDGLEATATISVTVTAAPTIDYLNYEVTDGAAGTVNRVTDSEPLLAEMFNSTGCVQVTTGLDGFFARAIELTDNSTIRIAYIQLSPALAVGEEVKFSAFVKLPDDETPPLINASTAIDYDCSLVIDGSPRTPDNVTSVGSGWWRADYTITIPDPITSQSIGFVKYTSQSDRRVWVTGYMVEDVEPIAAPSTVLNGWSPLAEVDQTYKAAFDAKKVTYAATEASVLSSPYAEIRSYTGMYWVYASLLMYLGTGNSAYAEEALDQCDQIIAGFTIRDDDGYYNLGGRTGGAGITTHTTDGTYVPAGTVTSYLLDEIQGGSIMALVSAVVLSQASLSALHTQAQGVRDFVATNILGKWHFRGNVTGTLSYLAPAATSGGQDQALHLGVMAYALWRAGATPDNTETYEAWGNQVVANIIARMVDSQAVSPNTPAAGAQYMEVPGLFDTSHNNRYPYGMFGFWILGHASATKAQLEKFGKHFESMLWNQSTGAPGFSADYRGGSPFNDSSYSNVYSGWAISSAASADAETLMGVVASHIAGGGSITGNTYGAGQQALLASEMAGRAIRGSMS